MAKKPTQNTKQTKATVIPKVDAKGIKAIEEFNKNVAESQKAQIKSQQSLADIAEELQDSWSGLSNAIKEINGLSKKLGSNFDEVADLTKTINSNIENVGTELYEELDVTAKIKKINDDRSKQIKQAKDLKKSINDLDNDSRDVENALKKIQEEQLKLLEEQDSLSNSSVGFLANQTAERRQQLALEIEASKQNETALATQLSNLKAKSDESKLAKDTLQTSIAEGAARIEALKALEQTAIVLDKANKKAKEMGISVEDMADEIVEPFKEAVSFLDEVPGGKLISKAFGLDSIMDKVKMNVTKSFTESLAATGSVGKASFAALRTGAMSFMTTLAPILPILLAVAAALYAVKKAFEMDQEVTDMARGLGVSKHEATEIHHELLDIAATTKVVGANSEALSAAYVELAKSLGTAKLANAEMAETQVYLTKQIGMAGDEAAAFQKMSMANGKSAEQNLAVIQAGVESMTGGLMSYKDVAKDIAKSSKTVQASYKGNIAALTKAVVLAKKFGMTLDQTKKISDNLLDIETSLENEMKANVLTGKSMNLDKARQLALEGQTAEAAAEAMKQAGGLHELQKMNNIQRKAIAEAAGMEVEEMMAAAEQQENMNSMAKTLGITLGENQELTKEQIAQAAALGNEEAKKLAQQEQINSASEKLSALGDKLMIMFAKMAEPIMEMLDPLMEAVDFLFPAIKASLSFAFAPIMGIMDMVKGVVKLFKGDILGGLKDIGAGIIKYFFAPFKYVYDLLVGFFPSIGKLVDKAIGAVKDKIKGILPNWALKLLGMGEDKSKESKPAGKTSLAQKETKPVAVKDALIRPGMPPVTFDKGDLIMAGTNLEGSQGSAPAANNSNSEIASLLKQLIAKVDQPVRLNIGGKAIDEISKQTSVRKSYSGTVDGAYGAMA